MPEVTKAGLQLTSAGKGQLLYLKDFHFVGECPRYEVSLSDSCKILCAESEASGGQAQKKIYWSIYKPASECLRPGPFNQCSCAKEPYLKMEHACLLQAYHLPIFFSEDWLNAHYDSLSQQCDSKETGNMANAFNNLHISESEERLMRRHTAESTHDAEGTAGNTHEGPHPAAVCSDYRFLYLGPAGTWTPLHADVLR